MYLITWKSGDEEHELKSLSELSAKIKACISSIRFRDCHVEIYKCPSVFDFDSSGSVISIYVNGKDVMSKKK